MKNDVDTLKTAIEKALIHINGECNCHNIYDCSLNIKDCLLNSIIEISIKKG